LATVTGNLVTYVDFITHLVGSQRQNYAIYFDLSNAFDIFPQSLLLNKLSAFGLSGGYVNRFRSFLSNRKFQVSISEILPSPFEVLSSVLQRFVRGPLLFNVFISYLYEAITFSD
jgi:hypothetical protein